MNVAGNGFISTSVVYWNNSARTTTYNTTSTQLSISVTAQDIATPGTAQVVVVTPVPGGGPSTAVNFTITPAQNPVPTHYFALSRQHAGGSAAARKYSYGERHEFRFQFIRRV